ncbi:hypothetical protein LTX96_0003699 [Nakaseomyces glabratus]|nr:hypothetical protein LTX96_0003699 [Nakaseomyces glabratus]
MRQSRYDATGSRAGRGISKPGYRYNNRKREWKDRREVKRTKPSKDPLLPNFESSGLLELESNNKNGIALKYVEPKDAISPLDYFKGSTDKTKYKCLLYKESTGKVIDEFELEAKNSYLIGRKDDEEEENNIADILIPEETCSQQHCVIQFRKTENDSIKAYIIDLESSNGTVLNGNTIPQARYIELKNGDTIQFTADSRDRKYYLVYAYT